MAFQSFPAPVRSPLLVGVARVGAFAVVMFVAPLVGCAERGGRPDAESAASVHGEHIVVVKDSDTGGAQASNGKSPSVGRRSSAESSKRSAAGGGRPSGGTGGMSPRSPPRGPRPH